MAAPKRRHRLAVSVRCRPCPSKPSVARPARALRDCRELLSPVVGLPVQVRLEGGWTVRLQDSTELVAPRSLALRLIPCPVLRRAPELGASPAPLRLPLCGCLNCSQGHACSPPFRY